MSGQNNLMVWGTGGRDGISVTNKEWVQRSPFNKYLAGNTDVYHCPADNFLSDSQIKAGWTKRLRSMSMNSNWGRSDPGEPRGGIPNSWGYGSPWKQWHKTTEVKSPSDMYVFIDEHPGTINDAFFICNLGLAADRAIRRNSQRRRLMGATCRRFYHNKACGFGFSDGHSEIHKWQKRRCPGQ